MVGEFSTPDLINEAAIAERWKATLDYLKYLKIELTPECILTSKSLDQDGYRIGIIDGRAIMIPESVFLSYSQEILK